MLVFLFNPLRTTPNFPSPTDLPILKSSIDSGTYFFISFNYLTLLGGDRVKELFVEVGDAIFLNFYSSKYFGSFGVLHSYTY